MKLKSIPLLLLLATLMLVVVGCGGGLSEATFEAKVKAVLTAVPTATPTPIPTPRPTPTQDYNEAIRLNPQDAYAYNNRGVAYGNLGKRVESERDIQKAKELGYVP